MFKLLFVVAVATATSTLEFKSTSTTSQIDFNDNKFTVGTKDTCTIIDGTSMCYRDLVAKVANMESEIESLTPSVTRTTTTFKGAMGPDKTSKGWSQCWGYNKDHPTNWNTANRACGQFTNVIFAGKTCSGKWVEFPMTLKKDLKHYMYGTGSSGQQVSTDGKYYMHFSKDWWVLSGVAGWTDGANSRCWEPNMNHKVGAYDGHVISQECTGHHSGNQYTCNTDEYYIYVNSKDGDYSPTDGKYSPRVSPNFTGLKGPDMSGQGLTQCWGYGKSNPAYWSTALTACGDYKKVTFAGHKCDGKWVHWDMELDDPLRNYMLGGGRSSPQKNIDNHNLFDMHWSSAWWVLTQHNGWTDGDSSRCWEPNMVGSTASYDGHVLSQYCTGHHSGNQYHCNEDKYYIYAADDVLRKTK
jgi:hypothetical protein